MRAMGLRVVLVLACLGVAWGCQGSPPEAPAQAIQQPFTDGPGPLRGHEDITRFGVSGANQLLGTQFWSPIANGQACDGSEPFLLTGNCATDWPDDLMLARYGGSLLAWQDDPNLQELHFLRNHVGGGVEGAQSACWNSRALIADVANLALSEWQTGDRATFDYWIGHALHIIQDSFSAAHTVRSGSLLRVLGDVCSYDLQVPGVCHHAVADTRDRIWRTTWSCELNPWNRSWGCLTPQAQSAAYATAGFLRVVAQHLLWGSAADLGAEVQAWLDTASDGYSGYFQCWTLPN